MQTLSKIFYSFIVICILSLPLGAYIKAEGGRERLIASASVILQAERLFSDPITEVYMNDSIHIYVLRQQYENVPYPKREAAFSQIVRTWCSGMHASWITGAGVIFYDVRTGEKLGKFSCPLGSDKRKEVSQKSNIEPNKDPLYQQYYQEELEKIKRSKSGS